MTLRKKNRLGSMALGAAFLAAACAGTKLNDVGDIDGDGGAAGTATSGVAGKGKGNPVIPGAAGTPLVVDPGMAGSPTDVPTDGGAPPIAIGELQCEGCELIAEGADIRDVATTEDRVYWVEYDTQDSLGNDEDNGRLLSLSHEGGEPLVIAADLQGPIGLEVSEDYAYVLVDHSSAPKGETELLRLPLAGGGAEVLEPIDQDLGATSRYDEVYDWFHRYFVMHAGIAYWVEFNSIIRLAETGSEPLEILFNQLHGIQAITGDESSLYFIDDEGLKSLPYAGGTPTLLRAFATPDLPIYYQLSVAGDYVYALNADESYAVRVPKTGGVWKRIAKSGGAPRLKIDGDSYFMDQPALIAPSVLGPGLYQGNLGDASLLVTLAEGPAWNDAGQQSHIWRAWDVAPAWVYFAWDKQLQRVPRAD